MPQNAVRVWGSFGHEFFQNIFFLPSTTDRVEDIDRYMNSVNLMPIVIEPSEFRKDFDPFTLDFENPDRKKIENPY